MNRSLHKHQQSVVDFIAHHHGVLCLHSTGTGKTRTAVASAHALLAQGAVTTVVALVKKSILAQFTAEVAEFDAAMTPHWLVKTAETFFLHTADKPAAASCFLIVDEAHAFTNADAVVTLKMHAYAVQCARVMFLTATPYMNTLYDLAPIICMIKSEKILTESEFNEILGTGVWSPSFQAWLKGCVSVYLLDKNTNSAYPKLIEKVVSIPMNDDTAETISDLMKSPDRKPFFVAERQLSLGLASLTAESVDCEKCAWLVKHLLKWIQRKEDRIVIYTAFINQGVKLLLKLITDQRINAVVIDGDTSLAQRKKVLTVFNRAGMSGGTRKLNLCEKDANNWFVRVTADAAKRTYKYYAKMDNLTPTGEIDPTPNQLQATKSPPIPPAWSPAQVCTAKSKVKWGAQDSKKRWQRRYSSEWEFEKENKKMQLLSQLDHAFWKRFDAVLESHRVWDQNKLHALAAKTMSLCHFRVGGKIEDEDEESRYGVTTLLRKHCAVDGNTLRFEFLGKSSKINTCDVPRDAHPAYFSDMKKLASGDQKQLFALPDIQITDDTFRAYLQANNLAIRPKDFRTYHANQKMLGELLKIENPEKLTSAQRKRAVGALFKQVAADLNNTPAVCKSSYVFNPLWVFFITSPTEFAQLGAGNSPLSTKLTRYIELFLTDFDWKKMLEQYEANFGLATFASKDITTLIITDAGAESLDLKGVRHVVLVDSVWNKSAEQQIIGRGQRFKSHAHLPAAQHTIHSWKLVLDFPPGYGLSPERQIFNSVALKYKETLELYKVLEKNKI